MAMSDSQRAVFLDKDGTLVDNVPYNVEPQRIRLADGAREGLSLLARLDYRFIVVSNQPGVALGLFPEKALLAVEQRLRQLLDQAGVAMDGFYYCPHSPKGKDPWMQCICRKPAPGMLMRAARDHALDLSRCWMVGDILDDVEAGRAAGCKTILIDNGNETEWEWSARRRPHRIAGNLLDAASIISQSKTRAPSPADGVCP
jgi:histidinol-phosphate phosphatase family protein